MSLSKSVLRPFKRICLRRQLYLKINKEKVGGKKKDQPETPEVSVFHTLNPHWFLQPEVMETYLPGLVRLWSVGPASMGLGLKHS